MTKVGDLTHLTDTDLWMCKHSKAVRDGFGDYAPGCELCGMTCEDVLRFADEQCKYERESDERVEPVWWDKDDEYDPYDR